MAISHARRIKSHLGKTSFRAPCSPLRQMDHESNVMHAERNQVASSAMHSRSRSKEQLERLGSRCRSFSSLLQGHKSAVHARAVCVRYTQIVRRPTVADLQRKAQYIRRRARFGRQNEPKPPTISRLSTRAGQSRSPYGYPCANSSFCLSQVLRLSVSASPWISSSVPEVGRLRFSRQAAYSCQIPPDHFEL
jgi:hypothetical protein